MKKLVCFDLDNTLVYSDEVHVNAFNEAFLRAGLGSIDPVHLKQGLDGRKADEIIRRLFPNLKKNKIKEIEREHHNLVLKYSHLVKPISKKVIVVLKKIKEEYDLAIVSNCSSSTIREILKKAAIPHSLFKVIIGRDMVKHGKPAPDELLKAAALSHEQIEVMIGDSIFDIKAGRRAKVKTIGVLTGKFGYEEMKKQHPSYILKNIDVLPDILQKGKLFK